MKKRILSLLLAFLMLVSISPVFTYAEDGAEPDPIPTEAPTASPCPTCSAIDCDKEHKACDKCSTVDCTADHSNWCETCKVDNCGQAHIAQVDESASGPACNCNAAEGEAHAATCPAYTCPDCGAAGWHESCPEDQEPDETPTELEVCAECGETPCTCEDEGQQSPDYSGDIGKYAVLNRNLSTYTAYDGTCEFPYYPEDFTDDTVFTISNWRWDAEKNQLWYQLEFVRGSTQGSFGNWTPGTWILQNGSNGNSLIFVSRCGACGEFNCAKEHKWCEVCEDYDCGKDHTTTEPEAPGLSHPESGIVISGTTFPEDVKVSVSPADVGALFGIYDIPVSDMVFGLDISLIQDGEDYQPGTSVKVKVPVNAAAGTKIGLIHNHNGAVSLMGMTEVLPDGTVEFYTDRFSEFAGFTVDFHYNGNDYSIAGLTSIKLSELFVALEIDRDAAKVIDVKFSDTSLVSVTKLDGDWQLNSLQAFDTEETLDITFADGEVITIVVTDAAWTTDPVWDKHASLYYYKTDNNWSINRNRVTMDFYLYDADYPGDNSRTQAKHSEMDRVYKNRTATLGITDLGKGTFWFYGTSNNLSLNSDYFTFNVAIGDSNGSVHVERIHREIYKHDEFQLVTVSQKRYAGVSAVNRTVKILVNGTEVPGTSTTKPFPDRGAAAAKTQIDVQYIPSDRYFYGDYSSLTECGKDGTNYVDTEGKYYSYSGGDTGTYTIPIYSRYNVTFNGNGDTNNVTMDSQPFVWGKAQNLNANEFTRSFTVTYNPNGGTCSTKTNTATAKFNGWAITPGGAVAFTDGQYVGKDKGLTDTAGGTYPLYANWTDGTVTLPTPTAPAGATQFLGWYTAASGGTRVGGAGESYKPTVDTELFAKWQYSISYSLDGGTVATANPTSYNVDSATFTLNNPTKEGYNFDGWTGTGLSTKTQKVTVAKGSTGTRSYTANWTAKTDAAYTVHYYLEGSTTKLQADKVVTGATFGQEYTEPAAAIDGYVLADGQESSKKVTAAYSNNEIVFYYKAVAPQYTVSYSYTGDVPAGAPAAPVDNNRYIAGASVNVAAAPTPAPDGYTFSGWTADGVTVNANGQFTMPDGSVTFKGRWNTVDYIITYDLDGGSLPDGVTSKQQTYKVTQALELMSMPEKQGYKFTGWKLKQPAGSWDDDIYEAKQAISAGQYGNITLVAQWEDQYRYVLSFDANTTDQVSNMPTPIDTNWIDADEYSFALPAGPTRDNYDFMGWAASLDATADQVLSEYTMEGNANGTVSGKLYAVWQRQTGDLKLRFNGNDSSPAIVTVSGQDLNITLLLTKAETLLEGLPTGSYTITAESGNASYTASVSNSEPQVEKEQTTVVDINIGSKGLSWFTAFFRVKNKCS